MIDFNSSGLFAKLRKVGNEEFGNLIGEFLVQGEGIIGTYKSIRDGVVFTNKRIIAINVQGITGKKKDFTSIPYSKISTFSVETAGVFDLDAELDLYMSGVGKVRFEFLGNADIKDICRCISEHVL